MFNALHQLLNPNENNKKFDFKLTSSKYNKNVTRTMVLRASLHVVEQYTIKYEGIVTFNPFTPEQNDGDGPE